MDIPVEALFQITFVSFPYSNSCNNLEFTYSIRYRAIIAVPMVFLFIVTSVALVQLFLKSISESSYLLAAVTVALFVLSILFAGQSAKNIFEEKKGRS